jgi:hypothetical protein
VITPNDLMEAAALCRDSLLVQVDGDWESPAGQLEWTRRQTLEHVCALGYTWQLATRARERRRIALAILPDAPIDMLVSTLYDAATVLAEVARATPPEARAYHPAGMADAAGFVAMETDELLVHTNDILEGIDSGVEPSEHLAILVLDRLFPWWPREAPPWEALLWANGRRALPGHDNPGATWLWHCAPLDEWDGTVPSWDAAANRPAGRP